MDAGRVKGGAEADAAIAASATRVPQTTEVPALAKELTARLQGTGVWALTNDPLTAQVLRGAFHTYLRAEHIGTGMQMVGIGLTTSVAGVTSTVSVAALTGPAGALAYGTTVGGPVALGGLYIAYAGVDQMLNGKLPGAFPTEDH